MSKQSKAKEQQGYDPNPNAPTCSNCAHYKSEVVTEKYSLGTYEKETNKRCGIGGFAVVKRGTCKCHEFAV